MRAANFLLPIVLASAAYPVAATPQQPSDAAAPIIDNERVAVWDAPSPLPVPPDDSVWVSVAQPGEVAFRAKGTKGPVPSGGRTVIIDLKNHPVAPIENTSGYPDAFADRPGIKKLLENDRVIVWDYTYTPGVSTAMHFHARDVVVVYLEAGTLMSTTVDGQSTPNEFSSGTIKFNPRARLHTEQLVKGKARVIVTELK